MLLWSLPHGALDSAVLLLEHAERHGRHLSAQCLSSLIAEAEQLELPQLQVTTKRSWNQVFRVLTDQPKTSAPSTKPAFQPKVFLRAALS